MKTIKCALTLSLLALAVCGGLHATTSNRPDEKVELNQENGIREQNTIDSDKNAPAKPQQVSDAKISAFRPLIKCLLLVGIFVFSYKLGHAGSFQSYEHFYDTFRQHLEEHLRWIAQEMVRIRGIGYKNALDAIAAALRPIAGIDYGN